MGELGNAIQACNRIESKVVVDGISADTGRQATGLMLTSSL